MSSNGDGPRLSKREACEYLNVSDTWLGVRMEWYRLGIAGGIPYRKYGNSRRSLVRFDIADLDAYLEAHRPEPPVRRVRKRQKVGR